MRPLLLAGLLLGTAACRDAIDPKDGPDQTPVIDTDVGDDPSDTDVDTDAGPDGVDSDDDGVPDDDDCAPDDPAVYPGAPETPYNGVDDDCDPATPDDDLDGDGFALADDCDDDLAEVNPGAEEICDGLDNDCVGGIDDGVGETWFTDADGDGFGEPNSGTLTCTPSADQVQDGSDCDDTRAEAFPGADELCNDLDDDCDATPDNDPIDGEPYWPDTDGDGFGDAAALAPVLACDPPVGFVADDTDCDDLAAGVFPGADETCDGDDDDCDGDVDEDAVDAATWFEDDDSDGFGDPLTTELSCTQPPGYVADGSDCDDLEATTFPGADELCNGEDDDCDTFTDEDDAIDALTFYRDVDGDTYGDADTTVQACAAPSGFVDDDTDCDDTIATIFPGAEELCDGLDNDCNGLDDDDTSVDATWFADGDGDGFGTDADTLTACDQPPGYVLAEGDCDDADATTFPGADELCDAIDHDCDGDIEAGAIDAETFWLDFDGDGFGGSLLDAVACSAPPGFVDDDTDCDDGRATAFPGADELCNGLDDDCDGLDDEDAIDPITAYADTDGDGFGDPDAPVEACDLGPATVDNASDCDDTDDTINPTGTEVCNGADDDCDGDVDEAGATGATTWYADFDADGFGNVNVPQASCEQPEGYILDATDCNDAQSTVFPGADELCDGLDNDCNGPVDDGAVDAPTWYADTDGDGFGDPAATQASCNQPGGFVPNQGDCDDTRASANPGAVETCDSTDEDCDGDIDEDAIDRVFAWTDSDGDGYGQNGSGQLTCTVGPNQASIGGDCDDSEPTVFNGNPEICDGLDNDCNGLDDLPAPPGAPTWYADADADGFGSNTTVVACDAPAGFTGTPGDCNDSFDIVFPGAPEICDGLDNDCNTQVDDGASGSVDWYLDDDGDGFGQTAVSVSTCTPPSGYANQDGDCDDTNAQISPLATEVCNGADDDCDGDIDGTAVDRTTVYTDGDGDGFGATGTSTLVCAAPGDATAGGDCDDADPATYPGAPEACDGVDRDCNGTPDAPDPLGTPTYYADADGDGFGNAAFALAACTQPAGYVLTADDCDDLRATANPAADEVCNGFDDDCDTAVDEPDAVDAQTFYLDGDGDGFGDASAPTPACTAPAGYVDADTDCDDTDLSINPDADETCDLVDRNCDGDPSDGTAGESPVCAADSCLDVLIDGQATGSDTFWLDGPSGSYEEFCDFGTVANGWAWQADLDLSNPTGTSLVDAWVPFTLDIDALVGAGKAQPRADDLRVFTLDGPLLSYWVDLQPRQGVATVWVRAPEVPAGGTLPLVITYGNPDTERKSIGWWFDAFDAQVVPPYSTVSAWNPVPAFTWNTALGELETDGTNADYLLQADDVDLELPVYVETRARTFDNDGVGVMLRRPDGGFVAATVTDDYQGAQNSSGIDGIVTLPFLPSAHRQGTFLYAPGNIATANTFRTVGMYYDGSTVDYYVDGALLGGTSASFDITRAGLASFANAGNPGAAYQYLWIGSEVIDFDPETITSDGTGALGVEAPF